MEIKFTTKLGKPFCLRNIECSAVVPIGGFSSEEAVEARAVIKEVAIKEAEAKKAKKTGEVAVVVAKEATAKEARAVAEKTKAVKAVEQIASLVRQKFCGFAFPYLEFDVSSLDVDQILQSGQVKIKVTFLAVRATDEVTDKVEADFRKLIGELEQILIDNGFDPASSN